MTERDDRLSLFLQKTRKTGLKQRWFYAKKLSFFITDIDLKGWFCAPFETNQLPSCPIRRIMWLVETRHALKTSQNFEGVLRVNAAIWREIRLFKKSKAEQ